MSAITKYSILYFSYVALLGIGLWYWNTTSVSTKIHPLSYYLFGFFVILFYLNHIFLLNAENKRPAVFISRFMASTALRLFLFMMIMIVYAITHKALANLFIWHILVFYFAFTVFEIASLYRHFQKK